MEIRNNNGQEKFWELIGKVLDCSATESESREFQKLLLSNQELMGFYLKIQQYWSKTPELNAFAQVDIKAGWQQLLDKIENQKRSRLPGLHSKKDHRVSLKRYFSYAAAVILLLLVSALFLWKPANQTPEAFEQFTHIQAPYGSRVLVTLPDSSTVWLNAGSSIKYSNKFNKSSRDLSLVGEAYFMVAKQEIPFIVSAFGISLKVLGTEFNLKAYEDDETIEALLVSGSLKVEDARKENKQFNEIVLKPNQKVTFHRSQGELVVQGGDNQTETPPEKLLAAKPISRIVLRQKSVDSEISWKDGILIVESKPLSELARKLERRYDVTFVFQDETLKEFKYTGTLKDQTLEQVLNAMQLTSPILYTLEDKTVFIRNNPKTRSNFKDFIN